MPKKTEDADFTQRVLMSLVVDMKVHVETVERIQAQIAALAKEHGVAIPTGEGDAVAA
ncbi:MAG: hypothetical protein WBA62_22160 [Xanthobacteraceae bacterium]